MHEEFVVLVDERNRAVGTAPKKMVHGSATPLHRGFSVFLSNSEGKILVQQRAKSKQTWPLMWAGSCCGHPAPLEPNQQAIRRRLRDELGIEEVQDIRSALPNFRYRCELNEIVENEFCPVWFATSDQEPQLNPQEVQAIRWLTWGELFEDLHNFPDHWAEWTRLQVEQLRQDFHLL